MALMMRPVKCDGRWWTGRRVVRRVHGVAMKTKTNVFVGADRLSERERDGKEREESIQRKTEIIYLLVRALYSDMTI